MMMEFEEYDRNELKELLDRELEKELEEIKLLVEEQSDEFNYNVSMLTEGIEDIEDFDESSLDSIVEEIKYLASSMKNISDDISRREELKKNLKY